MKATIRTALLVALTLAVGTALAHGRHGHRHGHHHHHGLFWGALGLGVGLGLARGHYYGPPWYPAAVWVPPPGHAIDDRHPREPALPSPPEPIIYPRYGQSAEQTEADRRACDRWAMTQPGTMHDASVFHRATLACMEGRDYTVR